MDARSDLYGLGATLYFVLTGAPPFAAVDPAALVHAHIALLPESPRAVRSEVPASVAAIILKLLEKEPDRRYRSTFGLLADLEASERLWREGRDDGAFVVGMDDRVATLTIPDRLYGRDTETAVLTRAFNQACEGASSVVCIQGFAGIGKSALVGGLLTTMIGRRARFGRGKFDQFKRDVPFAALAQVIADLVDAIASEAADEALDGMVEQWRQSCGANLRLVVDMVPSLARWLPGLEPVPDLSAGEARDRLLYTLERFFEPLASPAHPLVMFIDDLQWADGSSVALVRRLTVDKRMPHTLVIGAMRDTEVGGDHALWEVLAALRERGALDVVSLGPLDRDTVRAYVADALQSKSEHVAPLADAIHRRSAGNPFFLKTLLVDLADREVLRFSRLAAQWQWDLSCVDDGSVAADVVDFLRDRMAAFGDDTGQVLAAAACVGVSFDVASVAAATGLPLQTVASRLHEPIEQELVFPLSADWRIVAQLGDEATDGSARFPCRFAHDRIQQAAHGLVTAAELSTFHLRIGLRRHSQQHGDDDVIAIARHLNQGATSADTGEHDALLLEVNLRAADRARRAGAFEDAWEFLQAASAKTAAGGARLDDRARRGLLANLSETAYLTGRLEQADRCIHELRDTANGPVDFAAACLLQAIQYTTIGRVDAAIDAGLDGLSSLGLTLRRRPPQVRLVLSLVAARLRLSVRSLDWIRSQPQLTEPRPLITLQLLSRVGVAAYLAGDEDLFALCVLEGVSYSLRNGHAPETCVFYTALGIVLTAGLDDLRSGQRYGDLGRELHARAGFVELRGRVAFLHALFTAAWNEHRSCLHERFATALDAALAAGDLLYASFAAAHVHQWNPGWDLERAIDAGERSLGVLEANRHQDVWDSTRVAHQLRVNLCGRTHGRLSLSDAAFDADACLARMTASGYWTGVTVYHITSMQMCCHYEAFETAFEHAVAARAALDTVAGQPWMLEFWTYAAIAASEAFGQRAEAKGMLKQARRRLAKWAAHCSDNFGHASLLAEAEFFRARGDDAAALLRYEQALDAARDAGFREIEALAAERAGGHLLEVGRTTLAAAWCTEAWRLYLSWGADGKAAALEERWGAHVRSGDGSWSRSLGDTSKKRHITSRRHRTSRSSRDGLDIDLISVMKASQALSSEIDIDRLLEKMLRIVMENAGAASGVLLLQRGGEMCLQAAAAEGGAVVEILQAESIDGMSPGPDTPIPLSIIHAVIESGETCILGDASADPVSAGDPFVVANACKSILCAPITSQGRQLALIYLENRAAAGFFSEERVGVLELLASQMSISLENALLYRDLVDANAQLGESFEQQRTLLEAYHRFVPREFLGLLGRESVTDIQLGTHVEAEMTILFSDIRGFTSMSERMTPEENFNFINAYLSAMEPIIGSHGGFIDKYIGDAIMALFPAADDDGGATAALDASVAMLYNLRAFNARRVANGDVPLRIGIGLNTGRIMLGTVGGPNRMDGTVISDAVNLASRIEGLTGKYEALLLVSSTTLCRVRQPDRYQHRFIGRVSVKGKREQVNLHEVLDGDDPSVVEAKTASRETFEAAVGDFERGAFELARGGFEECVRRCPQDGVARSFLGRIVEASSDTSLQEQSAVSRSCEQKVHYCIFHGAVHESARVGQADVFS